MRDNRIALLAFTCILAIFANPDAAPGEVSTAAERRIGQLYRLAEADQNDSKKVHTFCRTLAHRYEQEPYSYTTEYELRTCSMLGFDKPVY
ncbi:hypothetical protein PZN02_001545 [Sinorhizobium garamanticum]|uniref:Uncharacterized protein n=1 Tax=Sinorhizobium garamanticum TaxID=680247 RepID=A0ABY8DDQ4_9HYPH|nr:hypothetical protein [Sinorhizobium garamanticum]WEX89013.1 hypothetical protein PZN02_001545 [Sinorhizobium garamanticum]